MREDIKYNRLIYNTLFGSGNLICQSDYISHDLVREVVELFPWDFLEDTPRFSIFVLQVIQSELQRSSCYDTLYWFSYISYLTSPLGRKSRPTMFSRTEDLPALYVPSTAILGKLMYC